MTTGLGRTWLYVPGHRERLLSGALGRGADVVIADLEDAVPPDRHDDARDLVVNWIATAGNVASTSSPSTRIAVRVGADNLDSDIAAVVHPGLAALVVAKAELALLDRVDSLVSAAEVAAGMAVGGLPVVALIESATGILDAREIARTPRVGALAIGEADLTADLGINPSPDAQELLAIRSQVVLAARAAGLPPPIGPVCTEFEDLGRLHRVMIAVFAQGFGALAAIHPAQLPILRKVLAPDQAAVAHARGVLAALSAAGGSACVGPDGHMVDEALARRARDVLARADIQP